MAYISLNHVVKRYQMGEVTITAADDITFDIHKGQFVVIVGPSGAGKTTVLNILGGMDSCDGGEIWVDGREISQYTPRQLTEYRRHDIGFVFQFYNLIPTLTVRKNILMPLTLDKKKPNKEYFDKVVGSLGIADKLEALPNQLSGGQQQRVAIARSLIYRPALLLADEPTGNLDQKNSKEIIDMLKLSNRNLEQTILLITHDEKVALEAERIITIEDGHIISDEWRR